MFTLGRASRQNITSACSPSSLSTISLSRVTIHLFSMNHRTVIRDGYWSDNDWVDSSDKENNNPGSADDFDDIYDISDDDSQEELPETRSCVSCGDSQPLENFRYHSQRHISRRLSYSIYCEKCRKSHALKRSANRRKKMERNGSSRTIIRYVTWPEMMGFFERDAYDNIEYILFIICLLISPGTPLKHTT